MNQSTIWVVDDDESILQVISIILEQEDLIPLAINEPQKVVSMLETHPIPNLILLDVLMSGTDGRDISRTIKNHHIHKSIPIIIMTADIQAEAKASEAMADDFIRKPFDIDELVDKVKQHLHTGITT